MHPAIKIALAVLFLVGYILGTYFYEVKVMHIGIGWWVELFKMRTVWAPREALWNFIWVAATTFIALPHFLWAPVYLIKELVYLFRCYEHSKPFETRTA